MGKPPKASYVILASELVETKNLPYTTSASKPIRRFMNGKQLGGL
jgi:hypothetical protein